MKETFTHHFGGVEGIWRAFPGTPDIHTSPFSRCTATDQTCPQHVDNASLVIDLIKCNSFVPR